MFKLWKRYQNCLAVHPVKTQVVSSGLIWGFGDIVAQAVTHAAAKNRSQVPDERKERNVNWKRVATTSMFGFAYVGPLGHFWYEGLDRVLLMQLQYQPKSFRFVATKVALDGIIFGPLDLLVFFSYMGFSTGKSVVQVKQDVKRDFLPALVLEGGIWPILQVANFRFVPVRGSADQMVWRHEKCGLFTTNSCYISLNCHGPTWPYPNKTMWNPYIPSEISMFLWLAKENKCLFVDNLGKKRWLLVNRCFLCKKAAESVDRILIHCDFAADL